MMSFLLYLVLILPYIMAPESAPLAEGSKSSDIDIDFIDPSAISTYLRDFLGEPPAAWISIHGSHPSESQLRPSRIQETLEPDRLVDFDLKAAALNARLVRVELRGREDELEVFTTDTSDQNPSGRDEATIQRVCQEVIDLVNMGSYTRIKLERETPEIDHTGIQSSVQDIARGVAYGGKIDVTFHNTSSSTTMQGQTAQLQGKMIYLKASWVFDWPGATRGLANQVNVAINRQGQPRPQSWSIRLQAAMVDGQQGWITRDEPITRGIPLYRALDKYRLVYETAEKTAEKTALVNGVSYGSKKFHYWGVDDEYFDSKCPSGPSGTIIH
ncbi:hypothetical protein PVAG01_03493 [Phlyctema vagabunda]|uniref:Uncharacterized protein n=1 Tax=Phlyctema vagabunda TaxID=108571 RepID=A0ABR4PLK3_9HELO